MFERTEITSSPGWWTGSGAGPNQEMHRLPRSHGSNQGLTHARKCSISPAPSLLQHIKGHKLAPIHSITCWAEIPSWNEILYCAEIIKVNLSYRHHWNGKFNVQIQKYCHFSQSFIWDKYLALSHLSHYYYSLDKIQIPTKNSHFGGQLHKIRRKYLFQNYEKPCSSSSS